MAKAAGKPDKRRTKRAEPTKQGKPASGRRKETMEETRDALIRAGIELFAEQGLDGPSLDAICERAGYTRGAFYVHFADRDDFIAAVMRRVGESYLGVVLGFGKEMDLHLVTRLFVASVKAGTYPVIAPGGIRAHQLLDACARSAPVRAQYNALLDITLSRLADIAKTAQTQGTVRTDVTPEQLATMLLSYVIGMHTLHELGRPTELENDAEAVLRLLAPR